MVSLAIMPILSSRERSRVSFGLEVQSHGLCFPFFVEGVGGAGAGGDNCLAASSRLRILSSSPSISRSLRL